jgi:hypothetical protein
LGLSSCEKNGEKIYSELIVDIWKCTANTSLDVGDYLTFTKDGKGTITYCDNGSVRSVECDYFVSPKKDAVKKYGNEVDYLA